MDSLILAYFSSLSILSATSLSSLTFSAAVYSFAFAMALITEEFGALAGGGGGGTTTGTGFGTYMTLGTSYGTG